MMRTLVLTAAMALVSHSAFAGWYKVENYEGTVGNVPVHVSIQTYEFGSGLTVEASYYENATNAPVALYGKIAGQKVELCEIADENELERVVVQGSAIPFDTSSCPISLTVEKDGVTGTWTRSGGRSPVLLRKVASLDDTGDVRIKGRVAIPFWAQTKTHMFRGIYVKSAAGACMETLEVVDKNSGKVSQELSFAEEFCTAGMLMTPIYMNVQKFMDDGTEVLSVNFPDNRGGYSQDYVYDQAARAFRRKE